MTIEIAGNSSISGNSTITHKLLLDDISNIQFAFCDDLLRSAYTGYSVRIRRSSDEKEQDFGFFMGGTDWDSINRFTGGGTAYITRRYNQGLYGTYVEQTTALLQPQLIIDGDNSLPCALFNNQYCTKAVPDAPSVFTNDMHVISAYRTKSFLGTHDFYSSLGYAETGYYRYTADYIGVVGNNDMFLLCADAAWPNDVIVIPGQQTIGPLNVISHSRSGTVMYSRKNGAQIGSRSGVTGNLLFDSNAVLYYGSDCHQNCYLQLRANRFLTAKEQDKVEQFALNRYA